MSEKRFIVGTVEITDCKTGKSRTAKVITDTKELCSCEDLYELCDDLNKLAEENEQLKEERNYFERKKCEYFNKYNKKHLGNIQLKEENGQLKFENETLKSNYQKEIQSSIDFCNAYSKTNSELLEKIEKLEEENEELKRERDDWKSSTCSYMNKDSLLSMDCQIVQEALWELEKEIEFGSKREDLFFDLKEKFEKLNNHRIGVL